VEVLTPAKTKIATPVGLKPTGVVLTGSVIVLGANGRLGQACVKAFHDEGWSVGAFARSEPTTERLDHVDYLVADALDPLALTRSVVGYDVIVNTVNVSYSGWAEMTPKLTEAVARAAASTGATVIIPGNIYHYGADMPATLSEATHASPTTALGKVRQTMERAYQSRAAMDGFQALILRAGDYLDGRRTGGWFDSQIANKLDQGKITYPGPLDVAHEWAYLPDFARAIVALAEHRETLPAFCAMGFSGHNITGQQLVDGLTATIGKPLKLGAVPWPMLKLVSLFSPNLKGVVDMAYLWNRPHAIDGAAFNALMPNFTHTPLSKALSEACAQLAITKL
jgi:nucleoside-diphosphate-sugar epimerase